MNEVQCLLEILRAFYLGSSKCWTSLLRYLRMEARWSQKYLQKVRPLQTIELRAPKGPFFPFELLQNFSTFCGHALVLMKDWTDDSQRLELLQTFAWRTESKNAQLDFRSNTGMLVQACPSVLLRAQILMLKGANVSFLMLEFYIGRLQDLYILCPPTVI